MNNNSPREKVEEKPLGKAARTAMCMYVEARLAALHAEIDKVLKLMPEGMPSVSQVFMICDAYESGMGHGLQRDGHCLAVFTNPEHTEAYRIGYELGEKRASEANK